MAYIFIILSRLGRIWSSPDIVAGLACLSQLLGAVLRRQPCTRRARSEYEVRHYSGAVSIIQVLVVPWPVLAVTRAVVCTYSIWLNSRCQAGRLGFKGCLSQHQILNGSGITQTFFLSFSKAGQPVILVLSTGVVQSFTVLLLCSYIDSLSLEISSTVKALYVILNTRLSSTKYLRGASLLLLTIFYGRQFLKQQFKLKQILNSLKLGQGLYF